MSAVAHTHEPTAQPMLSGRRIVPADMCQYLPAVGPDDLLCVDFDRHSVERDGLYLLERVGPQGVEWKGCRRFVTEPAAGLMCDQTGRGDWVAVPDLGALNLRVAGHVERVYKPAPF